MKSPNRFGITVQLPSQLLTVHVSQSDFMRQVHRSFKHKPATARALVSKSRLKIRCCCSRMIRKSKPSNKHGCHEHQPHLANTQNAHVSQKSIAQNWRRGKRFWGGDRYWKTSQQNWAGMNIRTTFRGQSQCPSQPKEYRSGMKGGQVWCLDEAVA